MTQLGEVVQVATGLASLEMAQPRGPRFKSEWVFLPADVVIDVLVLEDVGAAKSS